MKTVWMILFLILFAVSSGQAAYLDTATILAYEQQANGAGKFIMRFTGNAGEPVVTRDYYIAPAATPALAYQALRNWVDSVLTELNLVSAAATAPAVQPGQTINRLAPNAVTPPAKSVWRGKVSMYGQVCTNGFVGSVLTACAALKSDIETTYQAGFLDAN